MEEERTIRTAHGNMTVFIAHPDKAGPFPIAVLYMDGVGYREQVKENTRRFAEAGYYVVAPDLFHRFGDRLNFDFAQMMDDPSYQEKAWRIISSLDPKMVLADTEALFEAIVGESAAARGAKVCVGYCMGARFALHLAAARPEDVVAAAGIHPASLVTHGADSPHRDLAAVRGELYFVFAENDQSATSEVVKEFQAEFERQGLSGLVERLEGTSHGFAMADLPTFDSDAAEYHFQRTLELWNRGLSRGTD